MSVFLELRKDKSPGCAVNSYYMLCKVVQSGVHCAHVIVAYLLAVSGA